MLRLGIKRIDHTCSAEPGDGQGTSRKPLVFNNANGYGSGLSDDNNIQNYLFRQLDEVFIPVEGYGNGEAIGILSVNRKDTGYAECR